MRDHSTHLLLLPHAGGGTDTFAPWVDRFPGHLTVSTPALPARPLSIEAAAATVCAHVPGSSDVALFGHSFGAAVAAESARILQQNGRSRVVWLGLSGWTGPDRSGRSTSPDVCDGELLAQLADLGAVAPDVLDSTDFCTRRLPSIRAQWAALHRYDRSFDLGPVPVTWLSGDRDGQVIGSDRPVRSDRSANQVFAGDHFYLFQDPVRIISAIVAAIREASTLLTHHPKEPSRVDHDQDV